jgi:PAS domain S-box-containing protein
MSTNEIPPEPLSQYQQRTISLEAELAELRSRYDSLQQSELRYRQLFENAPISMVLVNSDGYLIEMNAAAQDLYGLPLHQLNQQACPIFDNPQLVENGTLPYMLRALAGETVIEPPTYYDASRGFASGNLNYGRGHYFPLWDGEGHVEGFIEICPDFKDVFELQQKLFEERELAESQRHRAAQERATCPATAAQVANLLLRSPDYTTVLPDVVRRLGEAVGSDRCGTGQIILHPISGKSAVRILPEWCKTGTLHSEEFCPHSDRLFLWENDAPYIAQQLVRGEVINCFVADLPEPDRSLLAAQGNIAELFVPILVNHQVWGFIAFDNCSELRLYDDAEIAILKIAAESLAAAIERQTQDEALLQLEQERSQELQRINTELQQTLDRLTESEDDLRTLYELSSEGFYFGRIEPPILITLPIEEQCELLYQNLRVTKANPAFAAMYGANHPNEIVGMGNPDCQFESSEKYKAFIRGIIESGYNIRNLETEEIDLDGQPRYFLNSSIGVIRDGYYAGGWATQIDITELRLAQQALLQAEQDRVAELAKTNQALKNNLDRLATEPNLEAFLGHVLTEISQQLDMHTAWLYLYDAQTQTLQLNNWVEKGTVQPIARFTELEPLAEPILIASTPLWDHLRQTRYPFVITRDNAAQFLFSSTEDWQLQWADRHGIQSGINILLSVGDKPMGLLGLLCAHRSEFTSEELELVQALSQQATLAIQLTQLAAEAQQAALFEERNRLAGEIHDTLAQTFTGIAIQLELINYLIPQETTEVSSILDRIGSLAQTGLSEARRSVWSIYPFGEENIDLAQKLTDCVEQLTFGNELNTQVKIDGNPHPLSSFLSTNLLRIGQVSITNTLKHAQASKLLIELSYQPTQVSLRIKDNGCGFNPQVPTAGFGLISISERTDRIGGQLRITTQPGQGTEIFVQVPL